jgi:putative DNA primase/helicase
MNDIDTLPQLINEDTPPEAERVKEILNAELSDDIAHFYDRHPPLNNETAAELFLKHNRETVCYSTELSRWLYYDGKAWRVDKGEAPHVTNLLLDFNKKVISHAQEVYNLYHTYVKSRAGADDIKHSETFYNWAVRQNNRPSIDNTLSVIKARCNVDISAFDANDFYFNVGNGTIDLKSGEIHAHDPGDKITLLCETEYNPTAHYTRWDSFLMESCGRAEYVAYLQKELGYAITGLTDEELFFLLYGGPQTGKSTFYEPIMDVLGEYGRYMAFNTLKSNDKDGGGPREDLLRLLKCRVVLCSEVNKETKFDTALLKKIASGEPIVARGIHSRDSVQYTPRYKIIIGTNYAPIVPFDDSGSYRRIRVNPWLNRVDDDKIDKTLKRVFKTDNEARERILSWLIEGAVRYFKEGLEDTPREIERASSEYKRENNPLFLFIEDYCIDDPKAGKDDKRTYGATGALNYRDLSKVDKFVEYFNHHKSEYGPPHDDITPKSFGRYMKALPYESWRDMKGRGYNGIRVKTVDELNNDVCFYDLRDQLDAARAALVKLENTEPNSVMTYDGYNGYFPLFTYENFKLYVIKEKNTFQTSYDIKEEDSLKIVSEANEARGEAMSEPNDQMKIYAAAMGILDDFISARRFNKETSFVNRKLLLSLIAEGVSEKLGLSDVYANDIVDRLAKNDNGFIARLANVSR